MTNPSRLFTALITCLVVAGANVAEATPQNAGGRTPATSGPNKAAPGRLDRGAKTPPKTPKPAWMDMCVIAAPSPLIVLNCPDLVVSVLPLEGLERQELLGQAREGNLKRAKAEDPSATESPLASYVPGVRVDGLRIKWLRKDTKDWFFDSFPGDDAVYQCGGVMDRVGQQRCKEALGYIRVIGVKEAAKTMAAPPPAAPKIAVPEGCEKQRVPPPVHVWLCRDSDMTELTMLPLDENRQNASDAINAMTPVASNQLKGQGWSTRDPTLGKCQVGGKEGPCSHVVGKKPSGAEAHIVVAAGVIEGAGPTLVMCKWAGDARNPPALCRGVVELAKEAR